MTERPDCTGALIIPRLRVQNANAISSSLTHGFPATTAFIGLMWAVERKLFETHRLYFHGVGVVCHGFEEQVTKGGYTRAFLLRRNPVESDGNTAAIVEEGRIHLDVSLIFGVTGDAVGAGEEERRLIASDFAEAIASMRIAGGTVVPAFSEAHVSRQRPTLIRLSDDATERAEQFRLLRRRLLPGFALVSRDDLLAEHLATMKKSETDATALDAFLDLSRLNHHPEKVELTDSRTGEVSEEIEWTLRKPKGWNVPIPVGYGALSQIYPPGEVAGARDNTTPFRFVESVYSIGQWIGPHHLSDLSDLLWYGHSDDNGYRCVNDYRAPRID